MFEKEISFETYKPDDCNNIDIVINPLMNFRNFKLLSVDMSENGYVMLQGNQEMIKVTLVS